MIRVYVAAALCEWGQANQVARHLDGVLDVEVTSRWHFAQKPDAVDPAEHEERARILASNLGDLDAADVVIALMHASEPRCTIAEVGWALARGKAVVWTHFRRHGRNLMDSHPAVLRFCITERGQDELAEAVRQAVALVRGTPREPMETLDEVPR
jgi:nucleoside 2-deoxyribosyltransferase